MASGLGSKVTRLCCAVPRCGVENEGCRGNEEATLAVVRRGSGARGVETLGPRVEVRVGRVGVHVNMILQTGCSGMPRPCVDTISLPGLPSTEPAVWSGHKPGLQLPEAGVRDSGRTYVISFNVPLDPASSRKRFWTF